MKSTLELVDVSARVGMSPHEWLAVLRGPATPDPLAADVHRTSCEPILPLTAEEWREAMLSTQRVG